MLWHLSWRTDPRARELADRHYNRQSIGAKNFAPPGRTLVLYCETPTGRAFWITSYPFMEYVHHAWAGAWMCSAFRNEGAARSSDLIVQAVAATRWYFGPVPPLGMVTFVDPKKIKAGNPGYCYKCAGFEKVGATGKGLPALQLRQDRMPAPKAPIGAADPHAHAAFPWAAYAEIFT